MRPNEERALKDRKASEARELEFLREVLYMLRDCPRRTAIDGGANVGNWTQALLDAGYQRVGAFEPLGFMYSKLRHRFAADKRVHIHQAALLDREDKVTMIRPGKSRASTGYFALRRHDGEVKAIALDSMHWETVDLIKLDLEGAELRALVGARDILERSSPPPALIIEVIDKQLQRFGDSEEALISWLHYRGYRATYATEPNILFTCSR